MKLSTAFALLILCAFTASAQEASMTKTGVADEAALRENVRQMEEGWNTKSGALFAKPFATDADYVVINGMFIQGRDAIAKAHQGIFDTIYKDSTLKLSVKQIRLLRPDVAVVHVTGTNKFRQGAETRESNAIITLMLTKENGEWKIAAFQNTQVLAPPQHQAAEGRPTSK
ncbi:MAG TPA: SgcJ/EcaC family oxidoreductase [Pyrinomonadaceae bacterium]|nr:SgcJ/EcaC family oxidoreductase [Pyrinomonadaceae bacterium]